MDEYVLGNFLALFILLKIILSDEQLQNIEQIANKKIVMDIEDYIVGHTQSWKRRIGILKAKFREE